MPARYFSDKHGDIWRMGQDGTWPTGITLPRMRSRKNIPDSELMDEVDVVYQPLQGANAVPRRVFLRGYVDE